MSEKFTGLVEIQDSTAEPKVRITLSGDEGTAQFDGEKSDSPATTVSNRRVAVGKKSRRRASGTVPTGAPGDIFDRPSPHDGPILDTSREPQAVVTIGDEGLAGGIFIIDNNGKQVFKLNGVTAGLVVGGAGNAGAIVVLDSQGEVRIRLDGNTGDIALLGADCAEEFQIAPGVVVEPGMVMVIHNDNMLCVSQRAYDRKVAGIIAGAGDYRPGIVLGKYMSSQGRMPIALVGRTYCKVDARYAPIEIGDLLTTSDTPGHAMKANDPLQAFGAVIGKALRSLSDGQALLPVLIALQ